MDRGVRTARCVCECGGEIYLTYVDLMRRKRSAQGCAQPGCQFPAPVSFKTTDPGYVIAERITHLLRTCPEEVDPEWGGTAYEGVQPASREAGIAAAVRCLQPIAKGPGRASWHVLRHNEDLPYSPTNCYVGYRPQPSKTVRLNGVSVTVRELADIYALPISKVTELVQKHEHSSLLTVLIEESLYAQGTA